MASKTKIWFLLLLLKIFILEQFVLCYDKTNLVDQNNKLIPPIVLNTWNFTDANSRAWQELAAKRSALDAIEFGCGQCETDRCDGTVGWGGSPAESGETTLDALIMDGETYDVGGVGGLRRIKNAIGVARLVLERSKHSLLVGEMATKFALSFGFKEQSLTSNESIKMHKEWLNNNCQPNYWKNVSPDPETSCGPYHKIELHSNNNKADKTMLDYANYDSDKELSISDRDDSDNFYHYYSDDHLCKTTKPLEPGHDTIGMVAIDSKGKVAAGTSTNGLRYKILGRVGDSPIPGSGAYAAKEAGAAAATGDGDVIMRFLLSYQGVENLRLNMTAQEAADDVIKRQVKRTARPYPRAAVIVLSKDGHYGAACCGYQKFPYVISDSQQQVVTKVAECTV